MPKDQGQDFALYLTDTDPSASPGDVTNYDLVGFATENSLNIDRELVEAANKETAGDMEYVTGRRTPTIEGTWYLDIDEGNDLGQGHLFTQIQRDTNEVLYFLLTDNVTGHIQFYGETLAESLELNFPDQEMIEVSATLQVHLGLTIQATP